MSGKKARKRSLLNAQWKSLEINDKPKSPVAGLQIASLPFRCVVSNGNDFSLILNRTPQLVQTDDKKGKELN